MEEIKEQIKRGKGRPRRETELDVTEYNKQYYLNNKEKFNKTIFCDACACDCKIVNYKRHLKSKLHNINFLKKENDKIKTVLNCCAELLK